MAANPEELYKIDMEHLDKVRKEILREFNIAVDTPNT
jgi:hypothetical protein